MKQKAETWVEQLMERGFHLPAPPIPDWDTLTPKFSWEVVELNCEQLDQLAAAGSQLHANYPASAKLPKSK